MNALHPPPDDANYIRRKQARTDFMNGLPQAERDARNEGLFFTTMDQVWHLEQVSITNLDCFDSIVRSEEQGKRLYAQVQSDERLSHPMSQSESSSVTNTTQQSPLRFDVMQNDTTEKAHLGFPDASECRKAYGYLAEAAIGKEVGTAELRLKLVNGGKEEGSSRRSIGTGLKHHKFNKMYLERPADYFDSQILMITIPIYPLDKVLDWNGTDEYNVLAITVGGARGAGCSEKSTKIGPLHMRRRGRADSHRSIESVLHGHFMLGAHSFCWGVFCARTIGFNTTPMTNLKKWWKFKKEVLEGEHASIQVPRLKDGLNWDNVKVARARATRGNSLPDPYNMAVKAAVNFSAIIGAKVMPACPEYNSSDVYVEMNSTQDEDTQWPQNPQPLDLSSLLQPARFVV